MFIHYEVKIPALHSDNIFPNLTQILSSCLRQLRRDRIYVTSTEVFFCLLFVSMVQTTVIWEERTSDEEKQIGPGVWLQGIFFLKNLCWWIQPTVGSAIRD